MTKNSDNHKCRELISIIVPVYNVVNYLEKCVNSIIVQTYKTLEIILVDDGSTDGSGKLCDSLKRKDKRIHVIHQSNSGSTAARNAGLKNASGRLIGFVDSDDWIEPDMYEKLIEALHHDDADIAVGRQYINRENAEYVEAPRSIYKGCYRKDEKILPHHIIYSDDYVNKGISPNLVDKLFKKELLLEYQLIVNPNTKYAEDDICVYSCILNADCVTFIDEAVYHYLQHEGSVTKKSDEDYFSKITLFYHQMKAVFEQQDEAELLIGKLKRYMLEFILRGVNTSFGFGYGNIIPFYYPDQKRLIDRGYKQIILYGAGNVGRDFYQNFLQTGIIEVVLWVDKNSNEYKKSGYDVSPPNEIAQVQSYDAVVIAVENDSVAKRISNELHKMYGIAKDKILYSRPKKFIEELGT